MTDEAALLGIRLTRMKELMATLEAATTAAERKRLRERLTRELDAAQLALKTLATNDTP